jgi:hypothetical protein
MLQSSLTIPTINTNSVVFKGSTSGQATVQAQAVAGTPSLNLPTQSGTIPSSATTPIVIDPVTGIVSCPTCATSTASATPIIASRSIGQTLNLTAFTGMVTAGYATAGDGGGATFKNVGATALTDTLGSFTDSVGNHFQIISGTGVLSTAQFGAACNGTTDDRLSIQAAHAAALAQGLALFIQPSANGCRVTQSGSNVYALLFDARVPVYGWRGHSIILPDAALPSTVHVRPGDEFVLHPIYF